MADGRSFSNEFVYDEVGGFQFDCNRVGGYTFTCESFFNCLETSI